MSQGLTYETALALKKAGFPQTYRDGRFYDIQGCVCRADVNTQPNESLVDCSIPTLSELIEACGDKFYGLTKWDKGWMAFEDLIGSYDGFNFIGLHESSTPEEAVAALYLSRKRF